MIEHPLGDEAAGCHFNDVRHPEGAHVMSGNMRLRRDRGIWVEVGESRE